MPVAALRRMPERGAAREASARVFPLALPRFASGQAFR